MVAAHVHFTGTHRSVFHAENVGPFAPTGRSVNVQEMNFFRLAADDLVGEDRHVVPRDPQLRNLAILDTQLLSIFYRKKEIGTMMALGLTRGSVIRLFTLEGAMNAVLAALVGVVTTIVSYLPTRQIATLQPTEALRGRLG